MTTKRSPGPNPLAMLSTRESVAFAHQGVQLIDVRSLKSYLMGYLDASLSLPGGRFQWAKSLTPATITNRRALVIGDTPLVAEAAVEDLGQSHIAVVGAWIVSPEGLRKSGLRVRSAPHVLFSQVPEYLMAHPETIAFDIREPYEREKFPWSIDAHLSSLSTWPRALPAVDPSEPVLVMGTDPYRPQWAAWALIQWGYTNVTYATVNP